MAYYEVVVVLPAQYTDAEIPAAIEKLKKVLTGKGAEVRVLEEAGKVKLAYPIRGMKFGHYIYGELAADAKVVADLNRELELDASILRHIFVSLKEQDLGKRRRLFLAAASAVEAPITDRRPPLRAPPAPPKTPAAEKITMEELDKKLEEILNEKVA